MTNGISLEHVVVGGTIDFNLEIDVHLVVRTAHIRSDGEVTKDVKNSLLTSGGDKVLRIGNMAGNLIHGASRNGTIHNDVRIGGIGGVEGSSTGQFDLLYLK